jgi:hypothetical protein
MLNKPSLIPAVALWLLILLLVINMTIGVSYFTMMVPKWQSQGRSAPPVIWQVLIDIADLSRNRWFVVFPVLIVTAILLTRRGRDSPL